MSVQKMVQAAPFAAHLRYISSVARLPWQVLVSAVGVSQRWGEMLVNGVAGCPLPVVPPEVAERIFSLSEDISTQLSSKQVDARETAERILFLLRSGWHPPALARHVGLSLPELSAVLRGAPKVSRLTELQISALESSHRTRMAAAAA